MGEVSSRPTCGLVRSRMWSLKSPTQSTLSSKLVSPTHYFSNEKIWPLWVDGLSSQSTGSSMRSGMQNLKCQITPRSILVSLSFDFLILAIFQGWTEITTNPRCTQKGVASNFHTVQDTELHKGLNERYFQGDQVSRRNFWKNNFDEDDAVDKFSKIAPISTWISLVQNLKILLKLIRMRPLTAL